MPTKKNRAATTPIGEMPTEGATKVATPRALKPKYVVIQNKLNQHLALSVYDGDGVAVPLSLAPLATSSAVREDRLTPVVHRLVAQGALRIR